MSILFQALDYDKIDHNFTDDALDEAELVCVLYGSTDKDGASVALAVRGFQPIMRLRIPDQTSLHTARAQLKKFVGSIFNVNDNKRAIQNHVRIDEAILEEKTSIYTYQNGRKDRFLKVQFRSLASYSHFRQVVSALEHIQQHPDVTPSRIGFEIKRIEAICVANKKEKEHNKEVIQDLLKQKQRWEELGDELALIARIEKSNDKVSLDGLCLFDAASDVLLSFLKSKDSVSQWWSFDKQSLQQNCMKPLQLSATITGIISFSDLTARNDVTTIAPFMQAAFDIETYSAHWVQTPQGRRREFPVPTKKDNICFQIGIIFQRFGLNEETMEQHVISMKSPALLMGEKEGLVKVHRVRDERSLLVRFFQLVKEKDVDVFISYNGDGFDMNYIYHRAVMLGLLLEKKKWNAAELLEKGQYPHTVNGGPCASPLSRMPHKFVQLKYDTFAQAGATTHFKRFVMPGRIHIDLHTYMQRNVKLQSYKLDAVAEEFLDNQKKNDMPIERLFQSFENSDRSEIAKVGDYCLQDCALLYHLLHAQKLKIIESLVAISRVVYCPLIFLLQRGQQIKVFAQIDRVANRLGFAIPNKIIDEIFGDDNKYQGATVLEPTSGFYYPSRMQDNNDICTWSAENCLSTLDFASLYPTIMMAYNICYSTIVYKEADVAKLKRDHGSNIDEHRWDDVMKTQTRSHYLGVVQNVPAVIPTLLRELYSERKKTKKLMEAEQDPNKELLLDRLQYAHKLSLNSVYGFFASQMMPCTINASLVTCLGRRSLQAAIDGVKLNYEGAELIYGDTVHLLISFSCITTNNSLTNAVIGFHLC